MIFIGVDPGLHGAIAFLYEDDFGTLVVEDMPICEVTRNRKVRNEINGPVLVNIVDRNTTSPAAGLSTQIVAAIEDPGARKGEAPSRCYVFGKVVGIPLGILYARNTIVAPIHPTTWKKEMRVPKGKDAARLVASRLFPRDAALFQRVKDHGRAEAALLAMYAQRRFVAAPTLATRRRVIDLDTL
jgi:hypothetical protein